MNGWLDGWMVGSKDFTDRVFRLAPLYFSAWCGCCMLEKKIDNEINNNK